MTDEMLSYPYVKKDDLESLQRRYEDQRKLNDDLHARLDEQQYLIDDGALNLTKAIQAVTGKADEKTIKEIRENLKEIAKIERLSELLSQNIILQKSLKNKEKGLSVANLEIGRLRQQIARMQKEKDEKEERDRQAIMSLRNIEETTKEKINAKDKAEFELEQINHRIVDAKDIHQKILIEIKEGLQKIEHNGAKQVSVMLSPEERRFMKDLERIKSLSQSRFMRERKLYKARKIYFMLSQQLQFFPLKSALKRVQTRHDR